MLPPRRRESVSLMMSSCHSVTISQKVTLRGVSELNMNAFIVCDSWNSFWAMNVCELWRFKRRNAHLQPSIPTRGLHSLGFLPGEGQENASEPASNAPNLNSEHPVNYFYFFFSLQSSDSIERDVQAAPSLLLNPDPHLPHSQPLSSSSNPGNSALDELDLLGKTLLQQSLPPEGLQVKWYYFNTLHARNVLETPCRSSQHALKFGPPAYISFCLPFSRWWWWNLIFGNKITPKQFIRLVHHSADVVETCGPLCSPENPFSPPPTRPFLHLWKLLRCFLCENTAAQQTLRNGDKPLDLMYY